MLLICISFTYVNNFFGLHCIACYSFYAFKLCPTTCAQPCYHREFYLAGKELKTFAYCHKGSFITRTFSAHMARPRVNSLTLFRFFPQICLSKLCASLSERNPVTHIVRLTLSRVKIYFIYLYNHVCP